jgi:hypothetical protein
MRGGLSKAAVLAAAVLGGAATIGLPPAPATAGVINVEFQFTPFTGDYRTADAVVTVPGRAVVFLNGIPAGEQEIFANEVPVLFDDRQVGSAVWVPTEALGALLRKGKNTIRFEFTPTDAATKYTAHLRWSSVMDEATTTEEEGTTTSTNMANAGRDETVTSGPVSMERSFEADFAEDRPWHHFPAVTTLSAADRKALEALVEARVAAWAPDFSKTYAVLEGHGRFDAAAIRESGCLVRAYEAGARIGAPKGADLVMVTTGSAAVVIHAKEGQLFFPTDMSAFEKIEPDDQMCVGAALSALFPPRLVVAKSDKGTWEVIE